MKSPFHRLICHVDWALPAELPDRRLIGVIRHVGFSCACCNDASRISCGNDESVEAPSPSLIIDFAIEDAQTVWERQAI